ncbi:chaplin [Kitasatospora sp. NPDC094015]|uniref:chaplin n=1 Tax=Kitasatospora sp. NPDC094015 TaxID=3155205 RepID=UPI00332FF014
MATGSVLASTAGYAYAAAEAQGGAANSPGVGSGNSVQVPVDIPVNACGNTVDVVGLLNPAFGNQCGNVSHTRGAHPGGASTGGASTSGGTHGSPGVGSGNSVQAPVSVPVDACGNSVNVVGVGNPAFGNDCANHSHPAPAHPVHPVTPPAGDDCPDSPGAHNPPPPGDTPGTPSPGTPRTGGGSEDSGPGTTPVVTPVTDSSPAAPAAPQTQLASTGAAGLELLAGTGTLLLIGGGVLYRRARSAA